MVSEQNYGATVAVDRFPIQTALFPTHAHIDVAARLWYSIIAILNKH